MVVSYIIRCDVASKLETEVRKVLTTCVSAFLAFLSPREDEIRESKTSVWARRPVEDDSRSERVCGRPASRSSSFQVSEGGEASVRNKKSVFGMLPSVAGSREAAPFYDKCRPYPLPRLRTASPMERNVVPVWAFRAGMPRGQSCGFWKPRAPDPGPPKAQLLRRGGSAPGGLRSARYAAQKTHEHVPGCPALGFLAQFTQDALLP